MPSSAIGTAYLNRPTDCSQVLLKVVKVRLQYRERALETYAVLDDSSERTILLCETANKLCLRGIPEELALRTIRQETKVLQKVSVSPTSKPKQNYHISGAFAAQNLGLVVHSYPPATLEKRHKYLRGLPLEPFDRVFPLLLIGVDPPHLITPVEPVHLGPLGGPAAIRTRLGWTLKGLNSVIGITKWVQAYFQKPLSVNAIRRAFCKCQLKLYHAKRKPYVNMVQKLHHVL